MHTLDRNAVPCPQCLQQVTPGWGYDKLGGAERAEIRAALLTMQAHRCAYCERRTGEEKDEGHIEHFLKQANRPDLEMAWSNMYWSCQDERTCGKHKDKCDRPAGSGEQAAFDPSHLIDPCNVDPDDYLEFVPDGTVRPRAGISAAREIVAKETIRVFQLSNSAFLRRSREDAVRPYVQAVDTMLPHGPQLLQQYLVSVQSTIDAAPFSTAIRHFLKGLIP
ncbi:MAG: retron system putative HNH endonuclease [Phycisphaerales bacterium]